MCFFNTGRCRAPPDLPRPRQVPTTQQTSRSPAKKRASQPNSASDDFSKLPSRRRQVITTFPFDSAGERYILDEQNVSSNPRLCFFFISFIFFRSFSAVREFKSPCLLFIFIFFCGTAVRTITAVVLSYTHGGFVGCWGMSFSAMYCALLLYQVQRTDVLL